MAGPTYTPRTARQIRHWTSLDLLWPEGQKYTGTGVSRRYSSAEVRKAALLVELSRWHVPMTVLVDGLCVLFEDYVDTDEWKSAVEGRESVYLEIAWSEDLTAWKVSPGEPSLAILRELEERSAIYGRKVTTTSLEDPASALVVNLTKLFRRLQLPHGKRKEQRR